MIKYNWAKILKVTEGDSNSIVLIVHMLTYPRVPSSYRDPTYQYYGQSFEGFSFLLNPEKLLTERLKYTNREAAEYVAVASYRNYLEYNKTGDTRLHLIDFPLFEEIINNNRLLHMKDGTIHFKFEEALNNEKTNGY
tara:strand:- start:292 stop:702 length:411 start_codon:yes stop_codon:yes gene_type:complete